jgi:hypothetical protein
MKSRYGSLLSDEDVRRWYSNLAKGSLITADVRLRRLGCFCDSVRLSPRGLVDLGRSDLKALQDLIQDEVDRLHRENYAPQYIRGLLTSVKSWLSFNDVRLIRSFKIAHADSTPTLEDERVPTQEELKDILSRADLRTRVAIALLAFSGLRLESLAYYRGEDGLRVKDFPEMVISGQEVVFTKVPTMVVVRPNLSKGRHKYFTFLIQEGCNYLKAYLESRLAKGERLGPDSPIIATSPGHGSTRAHAFPNTNKLSDSIRRVLRPKYLWRPYVLRAYADTAFDIAESRGYISHSWRVFFMGHKGDIEARYSTNKGRLPPDMIEEMREAYKRCEPLLSTEAVRIDQSSVVKEAKVEALKSIAKTLLGIDLLEVKVAKERELGRELSKDEELELFESELKKLREGKHNPHRIVKEDELETYLGEGWCVQTILPSGRILIRKG